MVGRAHPAKSKANGTFKNVLQKNEKEVQSFYI
jgi:hypothetical protein